MLSKSSLRTLKRRESELLEHIAGRTGVPTEKWARQDHTLRVPARFSLIDNPEESLATLRHFVRLLRSGARVVTVDQSACTHIDLCAGSLLNTLALEGKHRLYTQYRGRYPSLKGGRSSEALEIVVGTGLPKLLGVENLPELPEFRTFDLRHGGSDRKSLLVSSSKEIAGNDLTEYVTQCYREAGLTFSREFRGHLGRLVGEVLGNAEDHGSGHGWWASAYLRQPADRGYGDLHITIFNFGPTLAESLQSMTPGPGRAPIEDLEEHHRREGYFSPRWTPDELWTVATLQEGVTRHLGEPSNVSRGVGMTEMVEAFKTLGRSTDQSLEPRMCLLSGHSHILFLPRHGLFESPDGDGIARKQITFNADRTLLVPPDSGVVTRLKHFFPGTLISLRFFVDEQYLPSLRRTHGSQDYKLSYV